MSTSVVTEAAGTGRHRAERQLAMLSAVVSAAEAEIATAPGGETSAIMPTRTATVRLADVRTTMLASTAGATFRTAAKEATPPRQVSAASSAPTRLGRALDKR